MSETNACGSCDALCGAHSSVSTSSNVSSFALTSLKPRHRERSGGVDQKTGMESGNAARQQFGGDERAVRRCDTHTSRGETKRFVGDALESWRNEMGREIESPDERVCSTPRVARSNQHANERANEHANKRTNKRTNVRTSKTRSCARELIASSRATASRSTERDDDAAAAPGRAGVALGFVPAAVSSSASAQPRSSSVSRSSTSRARDREGGWERERETEREREVERERAAAAATLSGDARVRSTCRKSLARDKATLCHARAPLARSAAPPSDGKNGAPRFLSLPGGHPT